jgi:predicted nucleic acid binding AN1-type Zn finger protein
MKQITTNGKDWLFVEIPEDAVNLSITANHELEYKLESPSMFISNHISLLMGAMWQLHATTDNITEEQSSMITEPIFDYCSEDEGFGCVGCDGKGKGDCHATMKHQSFATFLTHHNLTGRYAILRKL